MLKILFRHVLLILQILAACVSWARAQTVEHIKFTAVQMERAGIVVERIDRNASDSAQRRGIDGLRLSGTAVLPNRALEIVSAPLAGTVQALEVNSMQEVASGQMLARLYSLPLLEWQRDYVQLSAQARLAGTKLERDEQLFRDGIVSENRVQEARNARTQAAVAALERRQTLKLVGVSEAALQRLASGGVLSANISITAPAKGMVLELMASPGQRIDAGAPIVKIGRAGMLWLELQASRQQSEQVSIGSTVFLDGCDKPGRITAIGSQINAANQAVMMRAEFPTPEKCLRLNQFVEATVKTRGVTPGAVMVPGRALARLGGKDYLFVRNADGFLPVAVIREGATGDRVAVRGALKADAEVAVSGLATLKGAWMGLGSGAAPQPNATRKNGQK